MAATLVSAGLYVLAFPPFGWSALAWVALVPLLVALRSGGTRVRASASACCGRSLRASVSARGCPRRWPHYTQQPLVVGWALPARPDRVHRSAVLHGLRGRLRPAVAPARESAVRRGGADRRRARAQPAAERLADLPRRLARAAASATRRPACCRSCRWRRGSGVYGVSFALAAVNAALADALVALRAGGLDRRASSALALAGAVAARRRRVGRARAARRRGRERPRTASRSRSCRPTSIRARAGASRVRTSTLEVHLRMTAELLAEHPPALVFWPEAALTFFLEQETLYRERDRAAARGERRGAGGRRAALRGTRRPALPQQHLRDGRNGRDCARATTRSTCCRSWSTSRSASTCCGAASAGCACSRRAARRRRCRRARAAPASWSATRACCRSSPPSASPTAPSIWSIRRTTAGSRTRAISASSSTWSRCARSSSAATWCG